MTGSVRNPGLSNSKPLLSLDTRKSVHEAVSHFIFLGLSLVLQGTALRDGLVPRSQGLNMKPPRKVHSIPRLELSVDKLSGEGGGDGMSEGGASLGS